VFENRVLRKIFGPNWDLVKEEWRRPHNENLNDLYLSPNIIRMSKSRIMRWAGHVARMGDSRDAYGVLVERPEGKKPLERPRHRWVDNIF
jgi:hypothetical protein